MTEQYRCIHNPAVKPDDLPHQRASPPMKISQIAFLSGLRSQGRHGLRLPLVICRQACAYVFLYRPTTGSVLHRG